MTHDNPLLKATSGGSVDHLGFDIICLPNDQGELDTQWLQSLKDSAPNQRLCTLPRLAKQHDLIALETLQLGTKGWLHLLSQSVAEPCLVIKSGLVPPPFLNSRLQALIQRGQLPPVIALPGNHSPDLNPLSQLSGDFESAGIDTLIWNVSEAIVAEMEPELEQHIPAALVLPATEANTPALNQPRLALTDCCYILDPTVPLKSEQILSPITQDLFGVVRARLETLAMAGYTQLPAIGLDGKPVTLHISHDWGGGIARWIQDLQEKDSTGHHLVLASTAPPDSSQYGQKLVLYAQGPKRAPTQEFWLDPVIADTSPHHQSYDAFLKWVIGHFGVGRIMVSSLIGHSLDCLKQPIPTAQVLHDFYPASPVLDIDPLSHHTVEKGLDLPGLIQNHKKTFKFVNDSAIHWASVRKHWFDEVNTNNVTLIGPSSHVIDRWQTLFDNKLNNIACIPHGFDCPIQWRDTKLNTPPMKPNEQLRLAVVGRLSSGKGLKRLVETAQHFEKRIHFSVVGGGFEAMQLFGRPNIDVLLDYEQNKLPEKLKEIAPHAVLFLSRVPETWNYVLSEIRCLALPVIAPDAGSFAERIDHGVSGLLYGAGGNDLLNLLNGLLNNEIRLPSAATMRAEPGLSETVAAYHEKVPPVISGIYFLPHITRSPRAFGHLDEILRKTVQREKQLICETDQLHARITDQAALLDQLDRSVKERTNWALDLNVALTDRTYELQQLIQTHQALLQEKTQTHGEHEDLDSMGAVSSNARDEGERSDRVHWATTDQLNQLREQHETLQADLSEILGSRSWRFTRPLRVSARILKAIRHRRAWHPFNWVRQSKRLVHALRVHGWRTTLEALQYHRPLDSFQPSDIEPVVTPNTADVPSKVVFNHPTSSDEPVKVSIIIPVYNNLAYTANCLLSLVKHDSDQPIEIIVVNDCSDDQTADFLDQCEGIEVIHNTKNLGFIGSCNVGAEKAQGEYLVFLNNDTQVTEQWLTALLEPFRTWPNTGIVGARLVYPTGELQEAGGIIFKDGSGWNYGRMGSAIASRVQFVSEADYVSGACLAIRSETFHSLGGFDTHYSPAYYEDTDLCFKVREAGLKVLYQPRSTIIHFEGISSGTSESSGTKRYQAINREKFKKRWAKQLKSHPEPVPGPRAIHLIEKARHHRSKGHVLVIDAVTPQPDHDSGSLRMLAILELLVEMGYRVSFMPINLVWDGRYSETLQSKGIETIYHPETKSPRLWLETYGGLLDWVIGSRYYVLDDVFSDLERYAPQAKVIFDTVDLHFLREQRKASLENDKNIAKTAEVTRQTETTLIKKSHVTLVVSSVEKDLLDDQLPLSKIRVLSNIHTVKNTITPFQERSGLLFVGGFQHPPNVDAARWLIEDILPLLRSKDPSIDLHLIGSRMPEWLQRTQAPGLCNHGFVEDLAPHLDQCKVALAPLRYGAGVKGKVNQAMAHGIPVVATSMAAEGLHTKHNDDILIADDTESFVDEIIRVYNDDALWLRLSEGGQANVNAHFSREAAHLVLEEILSEPSGG